jgi:hypothetical protein
MTQPFGDESEAVSLSTLKSKGQSESSPIVHSRQTYRRQSSAQGMTYEHLPDEDHDAAALAENAQEPPTYGLGLRHISPASSSVRRVPVGSRRSVPSASTIPAPPHVLSPEGSSFSEATTTRDSPLKSADRANEAWRTSGRTSFTPSQQTISFYDSDVDLINHSRGSGIDCPTEGDVLTSPWSFLTVSILLLSIYSTILSGIFLGIALAKPRWGQRVGVRGHMSYSTATLLSALFSKTIELSFVTVFVALLGQILSRRAFAKNSKHTQGISIAEMSMRTWIMQPGSLITHWHSVQYAALSVLGALALLATIAATFYTTAAEALVAPKLRFGPLDDRILSGTVKTAFANTKYLSDTCRTPITTSVDPENSGLTCLQIVYAGQSYHHFSTWLSQWTAISSSGNATKTSSLDGRPKPFAMFYDNTTVTGQWITPSNENITADSSLHGRLVQNVTMAMPHVNIFNAVREPRNNIPQPQDLQGAGAYQISASLPSPSLNILCVGLTTEELEPLVYNATGEGPRDVMPATAVDGIFNFGNNSDQQPAAQFAKIPLPFNTVYNVTEPFGTNAVYLLATPPDTVAVNYHALCSLKASQYPNCTSFYNASESGGSLSVHCDSDPGNSIPYVKSDSSAVPGFIEQNWKDIGAEWIRSTALSHGVNDANASIARLVTQMIPSYELDVPTTLSPMLPSIAEALGVLAGCTMVMSSDYAPFVHFYNYTPATLAEPQTQYFNATVRYKDYQSGANQNWQGIFYVILIIIFIVNFCSLGYLVKTVFWDGQVTDYTEPENLFAIANLSPPSQSLRGACGGGPKGRMLGKKWKIDMKTADGENTDKSLHPDLASRHPHFYVKCTDDEFEGPGWGRASPDVSVKGRKRRSRPRSVTEWALIDQAESPAVDQFRRLAL